MNYYGSGGKGYGGYDAGYSHGMLDSNGMGMSGDANSFLPYYPQSHGTPSFAMAPPHGQEPPEFVPQHQQPPMQHQQSAVMQEFVLQAPAQAAQHQQPLPAPTPSHAPVRLVPGYQIPQQFAGAFMPLTQLQELTGTFSLFRTKMLAIQRINYKSTDHRSRH